MGKGFTLTEILVVIIIISILGGLAIGYFGPSKEKVCDKEAISNLKLIQIAEKAYKVDTGAYYPSSGSVTDIATINSNLKLYLPTGSQRNWNYAVWSTGCARATRNGGDGRSWYFTITDADGEPDSGAGCP